MIFYPLILLLCHSHTALPVPALQFRSAIPQHSDVSQLAGNASGVNCPHNCAYCNESTVCLVCSSEYYLDYGKCSQCRHGCQECSERFNNCSKCTIGYYLYDSQCNSCPYKCYDCSSYSTCKACKHPYVMVNNECSEQKPDLLYVVSFSIIALFVTCLLIFIVRCIFCRKKQPAQSPDNYYQQSSDGTFHAPQQSSSASNTSYNPFN